MDFKKIFRTRRMKYGTVAIAFTAVFIAIVISFNAVLSAIDAKAGLYADLTGEQIYELGEDTAALLSEVDIPVEIVFLRDRDILMEKSDMSKIITLAEKYSSSFKNISVSFVDRARNPEAVKRFRRSTSDKFYDTDVMVAAESGNFRHLSGAAFFTSDSNGNIVGFNGEMRFTSAILAVTRSSGDKVVFITGHDETPTTQLAEVLMNAGYDSADTFVSVDLATGDIPEKTRLVIVSNPKRDFSGYSAEKNGSVNEIAKLDKYLKNYGNMLVFVDNQTPALPEFSEYLVEEWGISYTAGLVVEDADNSISTDGRGIIASYVSDKEKHPYAYEIARRVNTTSAKTVASSATPLTLSQASGKTVSPLLVSSAHSAVIDDGKKVASGAQTLMAISSFMDYPDGYYEKFAHVVVSGSVDCVYTDMNHNTANADLIYSILDIFGTEKTPVDIPSKLYNDTSINSIGMATARKFTVSIALLPTLIVLAAGIYMFVKRSRK